jgi:protocatechuate 3,4-dioxygenase beta subunit
MESNRIKSFILPFICIILGCSGQHNNAQQKKPSRANVLIGGEFENREFMYIGMPEEISSVDTSAGWGQAGQKLLITGTIFKNDGSTPAPDVILYYYHTDEDGYYSDGPGLDSRVKRHGHIRGWVKSDTEGKYAIYTNRPGAYPNSKEPAHIHPSVREPGLANEYYLDEFVFDDDPLLTTQKRKAMQNRGGSGVLRVMLKGDMLVAKHNIILGLNIPGYPDTDKKKTISGQEVGEDVLSFTPFHAWGPDKGSKTCPVCKYGRYHGILYFVGNSPDWEEIRKWLVFLENESAGRKKYLKAYFVYGNEKDYDKVKRTRELEELGRSLNLKHLALTFVPSFTDEDSDVYLNRVDPNVESTLVIYKYGNIIANFANLEADRNNFNRIRETLNTTTDEFFHLPVPHQ